MLLRSLEFKPHLRPGHPGGISLCGIKPRTKIEILGWGSCPTRSEPTSPDNPFSDNHFRETRRTNNSFSQDTTIALSHNEHNSGIGGKNHPTRKRQDTQDRTRVRLVRPIFSLPISADGGETAQVTGRADKAWAVAHADLDPTHESGCRWGLTFEGRPCLRFHGS